MVEKEGKAAQSFFPQADRDRLSDVVQPHLSLLRSSGDSSPHKSPRRPSAAESPHLTSSSLTAKSPRSSARPPFTSSDPDTGRDLIQRPSQSHSRPPSPFKSSDRSSHSPDRSHTQSSSRRESIDVSEGTNSSMHTTRDPKHKPTQAGQASSSHAQAEGINSQTPQRGSSSPSLPHGTKRKLSSDNRNMPTPGGDDMDSQLIGPGVPSSINISLEGPALKRRGSIADTQRVSQSNIFDRRHSLDARPTPGGPQWWSGDRRDSSSSMFPSPPVSYGSPTYSADSSHGHQSGTAPFAWHSTQSPDQSSTIQSEGDGPSSGRPFDPSSVPPLAMVPPAPFSAERRMSVPTNLPSTMSTNFTASRVLRSRSRPLSGGRPRTIESAAGDSAASQAAAESESGGAGSASSSTALPQMSLKDAALTPYSRSPELRVSHKLAERKRRKEMKDLFDELRDQLPADRGMKASKWEILSKAIDFIMQLKQGHQDMTREIDMLRHELESIRGGVPPFGPGGPHPGMYPPGPPSVVPYPPHPPGHALPPHQPSQVPNHQSAPPPPAQSDSRPGSSQNAFNASAAPQSGGGSGGTSGQKPEASST